MEASAFHDGTASRSTSALAALRGREAGYQAFLLLRIAFTVAPIAFGLDKFFNVMVDWPIYLAPWINDIAPGSGQDFMYLVGGVEILAGVLVAIKPRYGAPVVAAWLAGIIVNLLTVPGFYDVALRDFGLLLGALTLARLALSYDPPLQARPVLTGAMSVPAAQSGLALVDDGEAPTRRIDHEALQHAVARRAARARRRRRRRRPARDPRRVAEAYAELLTPPAFRATTFPNEDGYDGLIVAQAIPFHSLCMHHLLPFRGLAHVGYLPGERIVGLSKLARVVELFARDLQIQERLTVQIADWLQAELRPAGVGVVLEAEHMCMSLRGVQQPGARTVTSALRGAIRDDHRDPPGVPGPDDEDFP